MSLLTVGGRSVDVVHVASQLNAQLDVLWIPESVEQVWLEWLVGKIFQVLPPELISLLTDASDGLSEEEIAAHTEELTALANGIIDIPLLSESMEATLIEPVVRQLLGYAVIGKALTLTA